MASTRRRVRKVIAGGCVLGALLASLPHPSPVAATPPTSFAAALPRLGDRGPTVVALQQALIRSGIAVRGGADGIFGSATADAVRAFQRAKKLPVTGSLDSATAIALGLQSPPAVAAMPLQGAVRAGTPALPKLGERGAAVVALQRALIRAGIAVRGGADGIFGSGTAAAVKAFQRARGLNVTGIVDLATARALGIAPPSAPATSTTTTGPSSSTTSTTTPTTTSTVVATTAPGMPKRGDRGAAVVALQRALIRAGIAVRGGADGIFGAATTEAVRAFQRAKGLSITGVVDTATAGRLGLSPTSVSSTTSPTTVTPTSKPSTPSGGSFPTYGERGARVVALQKALIAAGITVAGGADGIFGSATATAIRTFQRGKGIPVTGVVDSATAKALGLIAAPPPGTSSVSAKFDVFPVQGWCAFVDTWHAPRSGGRLHEGVDLISATGKEIYAVANGTITRVYLDRPGSLSGNGYRLTVPNGTYYFYAHLSAFAPGIELGTVVKAGQLLGYVGSTGSSSVPHLHFEVHPGGGAAVNPYPYVKAIDACSVTTPRPQPVA